MAKLSNLDLINEAGSTFALYTLLRNHALALGLLSGTVFNYTTSAGPDVEVTAEDGGKYFVDGVAATDVLVTLPLAADNLGMTVFGKFTSGVAGNLEFLVESGDALDGAVDAVLDLNTAGDFCEFIATEQGWKTMCKVVA